MDNGMVIGGLAGSSGGVQGDAGLEEGGEGDGHFEGVVDDGRGGGKKMGREVLGDCGGGVVKCWRCVEDVYCVGWIDGEVVW